MRKPYLAGNWKMNLDRRAALELAGTLGEHLGTRDDVDVAVAPPFVYLEAVVAALEGSPILVGAHRTCALRRRVPSPARSRPRCCATWVPTS